MPDAPDAWHKTDGDGGQSLATRIDYDYRYVMSVKTLRGSLYKGVQCVNYVFSHLPSKGRVFQFYHRVFEYFEHEHCADHPSKNPSSHHN